MARRDRFAYPTTVASVICVAAPDPSSARGRQQDHLPLDMTAPQSTEAPANTTLPAIFHRFERHLSRERRNQCLGLLGLAFVGAIAELVTLGAVLPFLAVLFGTSAQSSGGAAGFVEGLIPTQLLRSDDALLTVSILLIVVVIIAAAMRTALYWVLYSTVFSLAHDFGVGVYRKSLYQPYTYHLNKNSSDILAVTNTVQILLFQVLLPLFEAFAAGFVAIFIIAGLLVIDASSALIAGTSFALIYLAITHVVRPMLSRNSSHIATAQTDRVRCVQEGLGDIRDILLDGSQEAYAAKFGSVDGVWRKAQATNMALSVVPRFAVEGIGISIIVLLALILSRSDNSLVSSLPVLGALALGAQRLLPLIQKVYAGWSQAVGSRQLFLDVLALLDQEIPPEYHPDAVSAPVTFARSIRFDDMSFRYEENARLVLDAIDLDVAKGERIGIVGKTGSGKSTLMDLMMGLIDPSDGRVLIDGVPLTRDNRRAWQMQIAHVPQSIFLTDGSITENIALGRPREVIDEKRIRQAAEQAQLADVIAGLPQGYDTFVGERGVRLSGGQRQRIGIARALYKRAHVLIFDEATSALDSDTERLVLEAVDQLDRELYTMFFIAHQTSSMVLCDRIVQLEAGRIGSVRSTTASERLKAASDPVASSDRQHLAPDS